MTQGGDEGRRWQRECGDFGKWWRRECGDFGKWWRWEMVTKGSGDERVTLGSGDFVMAAWMLHGLCFGEEAGARNCVFFRVEWLQPAMKGTSCVRRVRLGSFWFLLCVLQWVVVPVCVVLCVSWICGCRSHWNGCMIVVMLCCYVRSRYVQVCDGMLLQNEL